ncbi:RETARDED ROOT GROWTH-LIKE-like protein [Drosera capensis]
MWRPRARSLDSHLISMLLSSSSSPSPLRSILTRNHRRFTLRFISFHRTVSTAAVPSIRCSGGNGSLGWRIGAVRCAVFPNEAVMGMGITSVAWNEPIEVREAELVEGDAAGSGSIPVRAFFFSTSVDLKTLVDQNKQNFIPPTSRMTNYVLLKFGDLRDEPNGLGSTLTGSGCGYMLVFQYGSVVLFNVRDHEVDGFLKIVQKHASGLLPEMRKDEYEVREKPTLSTWMQAGLDHLMLQYLNIDGIRTIGSVLGQSIALDYYVRQVDGMVAEFTDINRAMEKTGTFTMKRKKLFQLVGKANSNLADVILKLGLFERSDIAWKDAKYAQIWEYLRDEFELTQRFASLDFKLKFVEHNIRFLQEILQNRKSDFLEWLIIILIAVEIIISVYDITHKHL